MADLPKSELAIKRDEWFASEEGVKCCQPDSLLDSPSDPGKYLRNRLEIAFLAGAKAEHAVSEDMARKCMEHLGIDQT